MGEKQHDKQNDDCRCKPGNESHPNKRCWGRYVQEKTADVMVRTTGIEPVRSEIEGF